MKRRLVRLRYPNFPQGFDNSMDISGLTTIFGYIIYGALGLIALWGAFCVIVVWMRVAEKRFRSEADQDAFLDAVEEPLLRGNYSAAEELCEDDSRAVPQLALLAMHMRDNSYAQIKQMMLDRFQRDVLSDLEYRLSWVYTVIKGAPMVGLLGTVTGMMGAFGKLAAGESGGADIATQMAEDISLALITTAAGLAIAIPLVFCTASINVRIRKMEDLVGVGVTRFLGALRERMNRESEA
ncbi:MotA/TolQ/ExbB proton channel family protein [Blastopirellula marina]|uniref:Probable TolQ n=1 Tax=Blastopirellula marina DSM 3645 TaxID=314230 RepID=A4A0Q9_9BACT|nr:MotA/TolQ/ExbB proton channel family protein [Blastopirellula marina]EAQ77642.1 probable TolQ [Blastopirellula marina DSM 3645]